MNFGSYRELKEWEIDRLVQQAKVCRIAFADGVQPYLLPMSCMVEKAPHGGYVFRLTSRRYGMKMQYLNARPRMGWKVWWLSALCGSTCRPQKAERPSGRWNPFK